MRRLKRSSNRTNRCVLLDPVQKRKEQKTILGSPRPTHFSRYLILRIAAKGLLGLAPNGLCETIFCSSVRLVSMICAVPCSLNCQEALKSIMVNSWVYTPSVTDPCPGSSVVFNRDEEDERKKYWATVALWALK